MAKKSKGGAPKKSDGFKPYMAKGGDPKANPFAKKKGKK